MMRAQLYDVDNCVECADEKKIVKGERKIFIGNTKFSLCAKHCNSLSAITRIPQGEAAEQK